MPKKFIAITALAALAIFAVPAAASAVEYVPGGGVTVTVTGEPTPGGTVTVTAEPGSFPDDSSAKITLSGAPKLSMGAVKAPTATVNDAGAVSLTVVLPATAVGSQTATVTGAQTARAGSAAITLIGADSSTTRLASAGYAAPSALIWGGAAALLLGLALATASVVKRRRVTA
ncbi:hypothetical protein E3O25_00425 [Cryobacterium sp. TMT1-3]|uniref:hypothetical protein n=1 Tax=Cryobacterium sp. TMT1-3 TaxID=1259237 RepID=UPI00106C9B02|nr:hypothetical protein [Cryobacterium sp. TMT1-3]TFC31590.1 hypothetical protein E3O25_00425 [Cryobacterium sp. TMT1-3]